MGGYSIWVLEYSHVLEYPESGIIYGAHNRGTRKLPYGYVYIRGNGHHIMVDVGFDDAAYGRELARRFGVTAWQPPTAVLDEVGVRPEDIDTVFVTHAHFDHFGNVEAFPNATFYLQERELSKWLWAMALPETQQSIAAALDPSDILRAAALAQAGRLRLVDGDVGAVLPGINLHAAHDTHTFGSMWLDVQATEGSSGRYILAGDNVYVYENVEGIDGDGVMQPIGLAVNTVNSISTMAQMLDVVEGQTRQIVPVHEARLPKVFPSRLTSHGLNVTEIVLGDGTDSYVS
ncbi:N-acyl homoserine lactonase family protein [Streptomyces chartreusis]|uniref:N-acyl homoserine lactonase family protein n=1 Tax=Streptomyces chartreusis TaxID=1969 RepID=UPI003D93BCC2